MSRTATNASLSSSPGNSLSFLSVLVITAGAASIAVAVVNQVIVTEYAWMVMVALALLLAPLGSIKIPGMKANMALGEMISFTCAVLFGPSAGVIAAAADGVAISLRVTKTASKFSYNVATNSLSMGLGVVVTKAAFPAFGVPGAPLPAGQLAAAMGLLTLCYFVSSTFLITAYLSIWKGLPFSKSWQGNALWTSVSYVVSGAAALAGSLLVAQAGYYVFVIFAAAMAFVSLFYRNYFQRVEGANKRAEQSDDLRFRAIETLIATLGAVGYAVKGNVRRVERLTVELGNQAGCSSEEIKALRVAALLHDVGNLALPLSILEKPGRLTPDEFEKIRMHSEMSARIAESMGFEPSVATVIRHHHERYDGSGYPAGLKGDEIPLPARVLAIVDCYNALTSDRPYRQRVSRREALEIMQGLAGKAFDPGLLAKFIAAVEEIDEDACRLQAEATAVVDLQAELASRRRACQAA
jgi:putative nucleotidyltransferase with HDIG domain